MTLQSKRIIIEDGQEARVAAIVEPAIEQIGYRLVRVRLSGLNGKTLQIMAERPDGTMSIEDCEAVSRAISPLLDVEDPVDGTYHLEISSPGIDRALVRREDFEAWAGHLAKLETSRAIGGRKRFRGRIVAVEGEAIRFERDQPAYGEESTIEVPFDAIGELRLILTDDLIQASLKADKAARKARDEPEDDDASGEDTGPTVH